MSIKEKAHIKVSNYTPMQIVVSTRLRGYLFAPANEGFPSFELMSLEDIEYINSKSPVFRTGALRFEEDEEEEIFEALKYPKYKDTIMSEEDINDLLTSNSREAQDKILAITDTMTFDRVRGKMTNLINMGDERVSNRVRELVNARFDELRRGITRSSIKVSKEEPTPEIDAVLAQNRLLMEKMAEMEKKMKDLSKPKETVKKTPAPKKTAKPKVDTTTAPAE